MKSDDMNFEEEAKNGKKLPLDKTSVVRRVFSSVSSKYDLMNGLMSFGAHRKWKKDFSSTIKIKEGGSYLDLACGTGDISLNLLKKAETEGKKIKLILCDPSDKMLVLARQNIGNISHRSDVFFLLSSAEELPEKLLAEFSNKPSVKSSAGFSKEPSSPSCNESSNEASAVLSKDDSPNELCGQSSAEFFGGSSIESCKEFKEGVKFDDVFISFGIRNFSNAEESLKNIFSCLKESGRLHCMEFFPDVNSVFDVPYKKYLASVVPRLGGCVTGDREAYSYFADSIKNFYTKAEFKKLIEGCGFFCNYTPYFFGIVGLFYAQKVVN